ncbi:MAG TPA: polymorphic toxin-type HINT domain-containing protein [Streptosporangiaceae bacterium]|nr:polymorphic toxin-type HINT domain-containing protein [Streptosporangiaceae bacterium]
MSEVIASDPHTGKTAAEPVTRFIVTATDQDFTILSLRTPSESASIVSTMHHHPYWDMTTHRWTDAASLRVGDRLRSTSGATVTVAGAYNYLDHQITYNLTVASLHTCYVDAGAFPVLVHNNNMPCGFNYEGAYAEGLRPTSGKVVHRTPGKHITNIWKVLEGTGFFCPRSMVVQKLGTLPGSNCLWR